MAAVPASLVELDPERCYISLGDDSGDGRGAGRDSRRLHLCRRHLRTRIEPGEETAPGARPPVPSERIHGAGARRKNAPHGRRTYDTPENASSLRVPAAKLDQFVNLMAELVTVQAQLSDLAGGATTRK